MPEPTIEELLEWLDKLGEGMFVAGSGVTRVWGNPDVIKAVRAILEQHRELRWRDMHVEPCYDGHFARNTDYPRFWLPLSALPPVPKEAE